MTHALEQAAALRAAFDIIEESYEFMLAYAAQGRKHEHSEGGGESQIRTHLNRMEGALADCDAALAGGLGGPEGAAFTARFRDNLAVARSIMGLLKAQPSVSSEMIDNTNGLIAMRAFLTDIFFVDQAVLPAR
jgi:hypothetical protein